MFIIDDKGVGVIFVVISRKDLSALQLPSFIPIKRAQRKLDLTHALILLLAKNDFSYSSQFHILLSCFKVFDK